MSLFYIPGLGSLLEQIGWYEDRAMGLIIGKDKTISRIHNMQSSYCACPVSYPMALNAYCRSIDSPGQEVIIRLPVVPKLRMNGAKPSSAHIYSRFSA
jgi:hypothetical protein